MAMRFSRKKDKAVVVGVWCFLVLAGLLVAAADDPEPQQEDGASATAGNDMCDLKCQHHHDWARWQRCVDECHSREHHHPSRGFCEHKCQHHHDPARWEICVHYCLTYGLSLGRMGEGDSGSDTGVVVVDEGGKRRHGWETVAGGAIIQEVVAV